MFVSDDKSRKLYFHPLCSDIAQDVCKKLDVESEKVDAIITKVGLLGVPCTKDKIIADGNCFFRAISQAICGTQKFHRKIRLAVVRQLRKNAAAYQSILRTEYSSMAEYLRSSGMQYVGSWATEMEIQAAADCLGVNIYTYFNDRWLEYSCNNRQLSDQGVYLENCNGIHYENVVCVQQPELQCCYGYCKVAESCCRGDSVRL